MRRLRLAGTIALALMAGGVGTAQQTAPPRNSGRTEIPEMRATHPPEPVTPLPPGASAGEAAIPINTAVWTPLGPAPILNGQRPGGGPVTGRITGIAPDPADANTVYVSGAGGGVWKTTNGGITWTPVTDSQVTQSMGAIAVAPSNPNVIYAGTGEANNSADSNFGRGILLSTDAGAHWTLSTAGGAFDRRTVSEIAVDPTNSSIAYAAIADVAHNGLASNTGIWKTVNGGTSWINTTTAFTIVGQWSSVRVDPNAPSIVYAAAGKYNGAATNGVYKSTNGGANWTLLTAANAPRGTAFGRIVIAVARSNSQVVYVSALNSSTFGLGSFVRSDDGGATFTDLTAGTPNYLGAQGWYDMTLIVDPSNAAVVYAGGAAGSNSLIRSANGGATWTDISTTPSGGPHVDHHASAFDAAGRFLDGNDGGIYLLDTPSPAHWTQINGNLSTIQFQGIALHPTDPTIAFGGSQDNGTEKFTGTLGWTLIEGGDGGIIKYSPTNANRMYRQSPVASFGSSAFFRRSDDGGTNWVSKVSGITDNSTSLQNFYSPFAVDPGNGNRVLYGARHVFETTNGGDSWSPLGAAFSANVTAIGIAPSDANTIYAATGGSQTFVTTNHGTTWTLHALPVTGTVQDIQVSPTDPLTAYAVISAFTSGGNVFKTINGGTNWTNVSGTLPSLPVWSLRLDPAAPGRVFIGADDGVYVTGNDGVSWSRFGSGLPSAQVFQIELNAGLGILAAGTHGRGLWEISLSTAPSVSISANGQHGLVTPLRDQPLQIAISANGGNTGFASPTDLYFGVNVSSVTFWLTPQGTFSTTVTRLYQGPLPTFGPATLLNLPRADVLPNGTYLWFVISVNGTQGVVADTATTAIGP